MGFWLEFCFVCLLYIHHKQTNQLGQIDATYHRTNCYYNFNPTKPISNILRTPHIINVVWRSNDQHKHYSLCVPIRPMQNAIHLQPTTVSDLLRASLLHISKLDIQCETFDINGTKGRIRLASRVRCPYPNLKYWDTDNVPWKSVSQQVPVDGHQHILHFNFQSNLSI